MDRKKGQLIWDSYVPWVIAILVLVLTFISYGVISGKFGQWTDAFREFVRFRK